MWRLSANRLLTRAARNRRSWDTTAHRAATVRERLLVLTCAVLLGAAALWAQSPKYGVGKAPSSEEIRGLGIAIAPDGTGLPEGSGTVAAGRDLFVSDCARCHGAKAEGDVGPQLVGGQGTLATAKPVKTIGSYWPYATTVWDFINRAMPFDRPGTLKPSEVYSLTAFLLNANGIIDANQVIDAKTLPKVKMPNRDGFVADPRPDMGDKAKAKK
jgi:S-disulfanyl-L-cysteine oxidoreductase SoxD